MHEKKLTVIIMAAGRGSRFQSQVPKPYIKIYHKPVLYYSMLQFERFDKVEHIFVVISQNDEKLAVKLKKKYFKKCVKLKEFIPGGNERADSVYRALQYIKNQYPCDYIAIHDAARPMITHDVLESIWNSAVHFGAAAPGIPVVDTIKICDNQQFIMDHPLRENLIAIQTPQIFNFEKIYDAYEKYYHHHKINVTDDTEVYAQYHKAVKIVQGDRKLFKLTFKEDIKKIKNMIKREKHLWK
jgi:2-C-methyl-D-erythritol 4-phosphate cytidylyltransferase